MPGPMSVFDIAGRAMSAQLARLNTTASNLANAGAVSGTREGAFRALRPVFRTVEAAPGIATVSVERVVQAGAEPTRRHDPSHPLADAEGNVWDAGVDIDRRADRHGRGRAPISEQRPGPADRQDADPRHVEARPMTAVPPLANTANPGTPTTSVGAGGAMDQSDFLRLMTTQLTTQDPFNPVDNTQMVAQMAQFSQVAGIAEMNQSLRTIAASIGGNRLSDAASWIGHSMLVESEVATPLRDGSYAGEFNLAAAADQVSVNYVDQNGAVVHSETLGAREAGAVSFAWNGRDAAGQTIANGPLARRRHAPPRTARPAIPRPPPGPRSAASSRRPPAAKAASSPASACSTLPPPSASPELSQGAEPMSFYTSLSGLRGAQTDLSTISNNIANVGSIGFKRSRAQFGDIMPASTTTAGQGTRLRGIEQQFTQGGFETSARDLDLAIGGSGFFVTRDALTGGTTYFSRNGSLSVDGQRYLVDSNGGFVQVLPVDAEGNITANGLEAARNIQLPLTSGTPRATSLIDLAVSLPTTADKPALRAVYNPAQPYVFDRLDPNSYNYSQQQTVYDSEGNAQSATLYFVRTGSLAAGDATDTWDVHMFVGNEEASSVTGSATPTPLELRFDAAGALTSPTELDQLQQRLPVGRLGAARDHARFRRRHPSGRRRLHGRRDRPGRHRLGQGQRRFDRRGRPRLGDLHRRHASRRSANCSSPISRTPPAFANAATGAGR